MCDPSVLGVAGAVFLLVLYHCAYSGMWPSVGLHIAAIALLVAGAAFRACAPLVRC